jgi:GntR family transcriptional regulator / MocR family aminotransferase
LDLHLDLGGTRVRVGLEAALRQAVQTGRLPPDSRLPSSRTLAADLGVARNTVADVYSQLVAEGWFTARHGSGTRVAEHPLTENASPKDLPRADRAPRFDLRAGLPNLSEFPRAAWCAAARRAITAAPSEAFGYGDPRGRPELRTALAGYLGRVRGVRVDAANIVVCSGFTQGLSLLCRVLALAGTTTVALEGYGHQHHREVVTGHGLAPLALPVDEDGAVLDTLSTDRGVGAGAAVLTPSHQFPLGMSLAPHRRLQAIRWAARAGGIVIEDDYDGEFRYDRRPIGAMQALDPEHVVYAGTASKTLAPAVRLAWLVVPARLLDDVVSAKSVSDRHGSSLDELTLAELIASGGYDRHIRRCRLVYRRRRDRLVNALMRAAPDHPVSGLAAGLHAVLRLPADASEPELVTDAAARGLAVEGMRRYCAQGVNHPPALVLGYGTPPAHAFTTAVRRLCLVLKDR